MGGPDGVVLGTEIAATGADRDSRRRIGPIERDADVSAMTACVDPPKSDWVMHVDQPWRMRTVGVRQSLNLHVPGAPRKRRLTHRSRYRQVWLWNVRMIRNETSQK